jgi:hypothetical protein
MDKDLRYISRQLPVLIGQNYETVMARADIFQKPDSVLIQITTTGKNAQLLAEFLGQAERVGLSFSSEPTIRTPFKN